MTWQYVYISTIFITAAISILIAFYAWRHRSRPSVGFFVGMMICVAWYVFTSGMMSVSRTQPQALRWVNPHYFGLTLMLAFFITFVVQYTGREKWITRIWLLIVFAVPFVTQMVIETNPLHGWFIKDIQFSRDGVLMGLASIQYGGFFWFHSIYSYALVLVGSGLILQMSFRTFRLYRAQSLVLLLGVLPPLLASVNDSKLFIAGFPYPLVPIGFSMMGMAFAWDMFRHQMFDIVPVARDIVIDSMSDSMIVLDALANIVDINPAAQQLLGLDAASDIGKPAAQVFAPWAELVAQCQGQESAPSEIMLDKRYFDLRISPLKGRRRQSAGRVIILRDITSRKRAEKQLQDMLAKVKALQEQHYEQAIRDPLTGLYNRLFFNETIPRELRRAIRQSYPLSFVLMDSIYYCDKLLNSGATAK